MEHHEEFDKELEKAPKNADAFLIVLPFDRKKGWYDASNIKYELTEGKIDKEDIHNFLETLRDEVPRSLHKINYEMLDGAAILVLLIGIIWLGLGIYFAIGNPFEGIRAASVIISSLGILGSILYITFACIYRSKLNKNRVTKLEEIIAQSQEEIFSAKGALVSLSPLESYITIEMVWKYVRIAMHSSAEDAEIEPKIPSLKEFNRDTVREVLEESKDKVLIKAIQKNAIFNPEGLHAIEDESDEDLKKDEDDEHQKAEGKKDSNLPSRRSEANADSLDVDEGNPNEDRAIRIAKSDIIIKRGETTSSHKLQIAPYTKEKIGLADDNSDSQGVFVESNIMVTLPSSPDLETRALPQQNHKRNYSKVNDSPVD